MALTVTPIAKNVVGAQREVVADITFDNSYPTGGEAVGAAEKDKLGLGSILYFKAEQKGVASRICEYDYANNKIKLFTALSTEAANGSDQSTIVVRALIRGDAAAGV